MPGHGRRHVSEHRPGGPGPVRELPVLAPVRGELLAEPAQLDEQVAMQGAHRRDDEPVGALVRVQQIPAAGVPVSEPFRLGQLGPAPGPPPASQRPTWSAPQPVKSACRRRPTASTSGASPGSRASRSTYAGSGTVSPSRNTSTSPVAADAPRLRAAAARNPRSGCRTSWTGSGPAAPGRAAYASRRRPPRPRAGTPGWVWAASPVSTRSSWCWASKYGHHHADRRRLAGGQVGQQVPAVVRHGPPARADGDRRGRPAAGEVPPVGRGRLGQIRPEPGARPAPRSTPDRPGRCSIAARNAPGSSAS